MKNIIFVFTLFISISCFSQETINYLDNGWSEFYQSFSQKNGWNAYGFNGKNEQLFVKQLLDEKNNHEKHRYFIAIQLDETKSIFVIAQKRTLSIRFEDVRTATSAHKNEYIHRVTNWHITDMPNDEKHEYYYGEVISSERKNPITLIKSNEKQKLIENMPAHLYLTILELIVHAKIRPSFTKDFMRSGLKKHVKWILHDKMKWWEI